MDSDVLADRARAHVARYATGPDDETAALAMLGLTEEPPPARPTGPGRPPAPIVHGTPGGYAQHRRRGEDACEPCKASRRRPPRPRAVCGTWEGYLQHDREGTIRCDSCKAAARTRWNSRRHRMRPRTDQA